MIGKHFLAAFLLALAAPVAANPTVLRTLQSWQGQIPPGVPPLFQSSVATADDLQRVWTTCQVKGVPPKVDFAKRVVLVAVRNGSSVKFTDLVLDGGTLRTSVAVTPDASPRQACVLALVNRAGVKNVNGQPIGK